MNYMNPQQSAQGLASLGRGNDSMLMHVTPREVAGLQSLAMAAGGSLTVNPDTGLPEAGFLDFIGDYIVPAALTLAGQPQLAVAYAGGKSLIETGDPLQALMAAGMQYGAGKLGSTLGELGKGAQAGTKIAAEAGSTASRMGITATGGINPAYANAAGDALSDAALPTAAAQGTTTFFGPSAGSVASGLSGTFGENLGNIGGGLKDVMSEGGIDRFVKQAGGPGQALFQAGSAALPIVNAMGPVMPEQSESPYKSFDFTPVSAIRARNRAAMGYAQGGGISSLNPMQGAFDARQSGPSYGETMGLYAKGGYLDGPGDGMSDSIPATIEGKQPARLADGEFVIPADVVSHLGNGSTKAGSKRLYNMMARVRKARTGTSKQGKQIKADKYLPK